MTLLRQSPTSRYQQMIVSAFLGVLLGISIMSVRHYHLLATITPNDDTPIVYARVMKYPAAYAGDALEYHGMGEAYSSAIHWIPGLMYKYFDIDPYIPTVVLVILQQFILGFSIFLLAFVLFGSLETAAFSSLFFLGAWPSRWNLCNFEVGKIIVWPYAAHIALGLIIISISLFYLGRRNWIPLLTCLSGFIHPVFTLFGMATLGILILSEKQEKTIKLLLPLVISAIPFLSYYIWIRDRFGGIDPLSANELLDGIRRISHTFPWLMDNWNLRLEIYISWIVLSAISVLYAPQAAKRLWITVALMTGLMALIHVLSIHFRFIPGMTLYPLRYTVILSVLSVPMVINFFLSHWKQSNYLIQLAICALLYWSISGELPRAVPVYFLAAVMGCIEIVMFCRPATTQSISVWLLIVGAVFLIATSRISYNRSLASGFAPILYDAEVWAKRNTSSNAMFASTFNSWRTFSDRKQFRLWDYIPYRFCPDRRLKQSEDGMLSFFGVDREKIKPEKSNQIISHKLYSDFDEEMFKKMAQKFGITYLMLKKGELKRELHLSKAYENKDLLIYQLQ
jgi:hypothetical protein